MDLLRLLTAISLALATAGVSYADDPPQPAELEPSGAIYNMAQAVAWLDGELVAVGRVDGTLSLFRPPRDGEYGTTIVHAATVPARKQIDMTADLPGDAFVTSNDEHSIALWRRTGEELIAQKVSFDSVAGTATSALAVVLGEKVYLVTGHEKGFVLVWAVAPGGLTVTHVVDVRSPDPVPSPWKAQHVRGIAHWKGPRVVAGTEEGDIVMIDIETGALQLQTRYNAKAQRGINSLSIAGDHLLVVNCSVGTADKNAWLYRISETRLRLLDARNLKQDPKLTQVFAFSSLLIRKGRRTYWYAATQEGLLWSGVIKEQALAPVQESAMDVALRDDDEHDTLEGTRVDEVAPKLGAALAYDPTLDRLAAVAYHILLFRVQATKPLTAAMLSAPSSN